MILDAKLIALAVGALFLHKQAKAAPAPAPAPSPDAPSAHPPGHRVTIPKNERRVPLIVQGVDGAQFAVGAGGGGEGGA